MNRVACHCGVCFADRAAHAFFRAILVIASISLLALAGASTTRAGEPPFGNDGPACHGANQDDCRPDPQPSHGQDCLPHGNNPDGNDDHCAVDPIEEMPGPTDEPAASEEPSEDVGTPATQECLEDMACWDRTTMGNGLCATVPTPVYLPNTSMNPSWDSGMRWLYIVGSLLFIVGLRLTIHALFRRR